MDYVNYRVLPIVLAIGWAMGSVPMFAILKNANMIKVIAIMKIKKFHAYVNFDALQLYKHLYHTSRLQYCTRNLVLLYYPLGIDPLL